MSASDLRVIQQTKNWVKEIVIGLNLCPFAAAVFDSDRLVYEVIDDGDDTASHLKQLVNSLTRLDDSDSIETSLLIFPTAYQPFDDYLDFLYVANQLIDNLGYAGLYQLASFHPDYRFEGSDRDDASNFSNRSPYPMLHLIRESSIEKAVASYDDITKVPENNIIKLREIGYEKLQQTLNDILQVES